MVSFVLDTSVTMAWCFEDETTEATERLLDRLMTEGGMVPAIWSLEVANALLSAERRRRLTQEHARRFAHRLQELPITVDPGSMAWAFGAVLLLGREHGLTSYDAAYLELALRHGLPLATQDERLRVAAGRVGVPLL